MTDALLARVQQALDAIPHDANCELVELGPAELASGCDCTREQRIAQRVTEAIEASAEYADLEGVRDCAHGDENWKEAALRALAASSHKKRGTE